MKLVITLAACMLCAGCANLQVKVKVGKPNPPTMPYPPQSN